MTRFGALAAILLPALSAAADPAPAAATSSGPPGHWSVVAGETVSPDHDAIALEVGWPGVSFSYLHGTSDRTDLGIQLDLLYGREQTTDWVFGAGVQVPLRLVVNRSDRVSILVHADPGIRIYTQNSQTDFMTRFPVGGTLGFQATPLVRVGVSADLTMAVNWTHTQYFEVGPQFGFSAEYFPEKNVLWGLNLKFGPQFYTSTASTTDLAFTAQVVLGYRM
jgi:hypothetical protein